MAGAAPRDDYALGMATKEPKGTAVPALAPEDDDKAAGGPDLKAFGQRIREARQGEGIGLRELARRIECSPGLVSLVENGLVAPSMSTLYAITSELNVPVDELFHGSPPDDAVVTAGHPFVKGNGSAGRRPATRKATRGTAYSLVRAAGGHRAELPGNVTWRSLAGTTDMIEFLEISYPPGAMSCPPDERLSHAGEEHGYVIEGRFDLQVGEEELTLKTGDSISFDAEIPHRLSNTSKKLARGIWLADGRHPHKN